VFSRLTPLDVAKHPTVPGPVYAENMAKISPERASELIEGLAGWTLQEDAISRQFTFAGFPEAVAFIVRLGFTAEAADHHPDLLVNYRRVTVTYSTHSEGGLTEKDFDGARAANKAAELFAAADRR
jgi:4a-hydroxytetrahydrobiopterin dehydratase